MSIFRWLVVAFLVVGSVCAAQQHARPLRVSQLPPTYRQWLEEDVAYIINADEKREFLTLQTDPERDKFIAAFWEARNPDPGSELNSFKEEHYRRLAYANEHFGDERYHDGWRTDMGRVYITLGPPKQVRDHHIGRRTRPVEIWFYEATSPALPTYFNVVFYKRSDGEPYTLYSPRQDGPERIITDQARSPADALHIIDQSMGPEAENIMVSLIPGEPVDLQNPEPSMSSDVLLSQIRDLPDQPLEKERISAARAARHEKVTSSILLAGLRDELDTAVLRNAAGDETVHFLFTGDDLAREVLGTLPDKTEGYRLTLTTRVMTTDGKPVYQRQDQLGGTLSAAAARTARERRFAAEGRLPLTPGSYVVEAVLTNDLTHQAVRATRQLKLPTLAPTQLGISDLVAYRQPSPIQDQAGQLPFATAGLRFVPRGVGTVTITAGERLPLVFQLWLPSKDLAGQHADQARRVHVHYLVGSVAGAGGTIPVEEDEDVDVRNLDPAGNLLTGRTLDTAALHPGSYRVVVRVTEPGTSQAAFSAMTLRVLPADQPSAIWTAFGDEQQHPAWQDDLLRGIAAEAGGNRTEAEACYRRALAANPAAAEAQKRLAALHPTEAARRP